MVRKLKGVIGQAILGEEESYKLYMHWYKQTKHESAKRMCERLAKEELKHKALLRGLDTEKLEGEFSGNQKGIKLAESLVMTPLDEYPVVEELFKLAIKKEEQAHDRYLEIAGDLKSGRVRDLFERLASEEKDHRTLIEDEYKKFRF